MAYIWCVYLNNVVFLLFWKAVINLVIHLVINGVLELRQQRTWWITSCVKYFWDIWEGDLWDIWSLFVCLPWTLLLIAVYLETYGCQMNVNDTEIAWSILQKSGYLRTSNLQEVHVLPVSLFPTSTLNSTFVPICRCSFRNGVWPGETEFFWVKYVEWD